MHRTLAGLVTLAAFAVIAAPNAFAGPAANANEKATVKACKNLKAKMGARSFNALYAPAGLNPRAALRNCSRREANVAARAQLNAARTCKTWKNDPAAFAEAVAGTPNEGKTFAEVYGPGRKGYGKCVSSVARSKIHEHRKAIVNAAKTCRVWKSDPAAFAAAMVGTANEGKTFAEVFGGGRRAYGKCVSSVAHGS